MPIDRGRLSGSRLFMDDDDDDDDDEDVYRTSPLGMASCWYVGLRGTRAHTRNGEPLYVYVTAGLLGTKKKGSYFLFS